MKAPEYTLIFLAMLALLACGGTSTGHVETPADGDGSELAEAENEADGDGESQEAAEPGTQCAPEAAHRCADPFDLYTCTGGVWVLAAKCLESGTQCVDGACVKPAEPCKSGDAKCLGDSVAQCDDTGIYHRVGSCKQSSTGTCSIKTCNGADIPGCWGAGEECH